MKEVVLKCNANIFGFQFKKNSRLYIDKDVNNTDELLFCEYENKKGISIPIYLSLFERTHEDFIKEGQRINILFDEIEKEGGQLPIFEFEITNQNKEAPKTVTLFGSNFHLLTPNFGSDKDVSVKPLHPNISYLEYLQQSAHQPCKIDFIRLESETLNQLYQIITYSTKDANGQLLQVPIITQSYRLATDENPNELMVSDRKVIDGNSDFQFTILPDTKLKIKIYGKRSYSIDSQSIDIINSLISCQIQQGLDYVSLPNLKKFIGERYYNDFYPNAIERELESLFDKKIIDLKDGLYGYKFKILKVDGTVKNELTLTQVLKHSEFNLMN